MKHYKKIIGCADLHIRNLQRIDEYRAIMSNFISDVKELAEEDGSDSVCVVVAGDVFHNKIDISAEGYALATWFFRQLDEICDTYVIAGNHDISVKNLERLDPLSVLFSMCRFSRTRYLDAELGYESGCVTEGNVIWAIYSSFDNFTRPSIEDAKLNTPDAIVVGLFHGELKGSSTDAGYVSENGYDKAMFDGCDFVVMGHIHKRQRLNAAGVPLVYCGSLIQQNFGENVSGHGYVVWDTETCEYEVHDVPNDGFGMYNFVLKSGDELDDGKEEINNL